MCDSNDFVKRSFCARLPSKKEALKLKNETFLRDFLQKQSFEDQKRKFSARLPSNIEALKLKNEAFLRDLLQKRSFEDQK